MLRFTIRDLLWLMVVAGVCCAWWLDVRRRDQENSQALKTLKTNSLVLEQALEVANKKAKILQKEADLLSQLARNREAELKQRDDQLRDSLERREAVIGALRTLKEATPNSIPDTTFP